MSDAFGDYLEAEIRDTIFRSVPATVKTYANGTFSAGDVVFPSTADGYVYLCTVGGTTTVEPTWVNANIGDETTGEGLTWECCSIGLVKKNIQIRLFGTSATLNGLLAGTLTGEVSDANYVATPVYLAPDNANWDALTAGNGAEQADNTAAILFPAAAADYSENVEYVALTDSLNNVLFAGALNTPKTVTTGQVFQFNAGDLILQIS